MACRFFFLAVVLLQSLYAPHPHAILFKTIRKGMSAWTALPACGLWSVT